MSKSAPPQLENGYLKICNELVEILAETNMSAYQSRILWAILRKTYGYNKKEDVISIKQLAELTGMLKPHICRSLSELIKRKIITKRGNKIAFNKHYQSWRALPKGVMSHSVTSRGNTITNRGNETLPVGVTGVTNQGNDTGFNTLQDNGLQTSKDILKDNTKNNVQKTIEDSCPKKRYGDFVLLTDDQYRELVDQFGENGICERIKNLNNYSHQIGGKKFNSKYKSHYHTILNWERRNKKNDSEPKSLDVTMKLLDEYRKGVRT